MHFVGVICKKNNVYWESKAFFLKIFSICWFISETKTWSMCKGTCWSGSGAGRMCALPSRRPPWTESMSFYQSSSCLPLCRSWQRSCGRTRWLIVRSQLDWGGPLLSASCKGALGLSWGLRVSEWNVLTSTIVSPQHSQLARFGTWMDVALWPNMSARQSCEDKDWS